MTSNKLKHRITIFLPSTGENPTNEPQESSCPPPKRLKNNAERPVNPASALFTSSASSPSGQLGLDANSIHDIAVPLFLPGANDLSDEIASAADQDLCMDNDELSVSFDDTGNDCFSLDETLFDILPPNSKSEPQVLRDMEHPRSPATTIGGQISPTPLRSPVNILDDSDFVPYQEYAFLEELEEFERWANSGAVEIIDE